MSRQPASHYDVIVVGGGPAGSTTAAYLAMQGRRVVLLDKETHPRYRVGESLLPSMMPILEDFGLLEEVDGMGFPRKTGGTFVWGKSDEPWDVLFGENPFLPYPYAYHVERSIFDKLLLRNATDKGAEVREGCGVTGPLRDDAGRVVGVHYEDPDGQAGELRARFVCDASGPSSVIGRKVANRHYDDKMRQVAFYTYYEDTVGPQNFRNGHVIITSCSKGWFWWIPVDSEELGATSVGLVTGQEFKDEYTEKGIETFFAEALEDAPQVRELLGPAARRTQPMGAITDWAYACDRMAGPGFFLIGDAAAFLDPLLSTGVTMAMLAGYSASACIHSAMTGTATEEDVEAFYNTNYLRMWTVTRDFLHYFYAGNASSHPDDFFWAAREALELGENVGAKQAFCFMVNTIPGNPHPALEKQIHMFQQFMDNIEHPIEAMSCEMDFSDLIGESHDWVDFGALSDRAVPVLNGTLETSWTIDKDSHTLRAVRGISYDQDRTVFSSTSSWLLGRNLYPLADDACDLLELCDGKTPWSHVISQHAERTGASVDEVRADLTRRLEALWDDRFVLLRGEVAHG